MLETAVPPPLQADSRGLRRRISNVLYQRRTLTLFLILTPPLLWFGVVYVGSLLTLLSQSVFTFDEMAMSVTAELTADNFTSLLNPANYDIVLRTVLMAVAVTLGCVLIGFPMA
jgi:putative spermidine/putrescine transport system permease protein